MLKRTQPLRRKAWLKRSGKPIRQVSTRRAAQLRDYRVLRAEFLADHPFCQIDIAEAGLTEATVLQLWGDNGVPSGPQCFLGHWIKPSVDIHHTNKRHGRRLLDTQFWLAVSRERHEEVEFNKRWARAKGYLKDI